VERQRANLGLRKAKSRLAHIICEILFRLQTVGLSDGLSCYFPMRQSDLAEAAGLSTVRVNRTIQSLRSTNLLRLVDSKLTVLDSEGLAAVADFDPAYLHVLEPAATPSGRSPAGEMILRAPL
jgi:hypothetical protein